MANAEYEICNKICPEICDAAAVQLFLHRPEDDLGETQVITPNGDAKNDVLIFDYLDQYPDNSIIVFNRWGQRVYESKPYPNNEKDGWKGDWHGKPLPAGTYYFILNLAGSDERVWGNILVLR
jgi:gliding motility-associated-like protein